jgi:hypothetical protein
MKYAIPYYKNFRYLDIIDEVILYWSVKDSIIEYIKENYSLNQRIIISLNEAEAGSDEYIKETIIPTLIELKKRHNNITMRFDGFIPESDILRLFQKNEIRYYFNQFCNSWDTIYGLTLLGASDIIVVEEMGFDLQNISAYCKPRKIKIRVFPNVAQSGGKGLSGVIPAINQFFIRPEDTETYEPFVDVFELWGDSSRLSVVYEIYKQQQWLGDIQDIIVGFNDDVPNAGMMDHFAQIRLNCRKKCFQGKKCDICKTMREIALALKEDGLILESERKPVRENDPTVEKIMSNERTTADDIFGEETD